MRLTDQTLERGSVKCGAGRPATAWPSPRDWMVERWVARCSVGTRTVGQSNRIHLYSPGRDLEIGVVIRPRGRGVMGMGRGL